MTDRVPGARLGPQSRGGRSVYQSGTRVRGDRKAKPERERPAPEIDREAMSRVLAEPPSLIEHRGPQGLEATGRCHTCERPVSGERRYCGRCLANRMNDRST